MTRQADTIIIGGGILGLATAYRLTQCAPGRRVVVLEKESAVAQHQTGHNSGVLHAGVYYAPGSLKALTCRAGKAAMEAFCAEHGIPFETCGKVIVATGEDERGRLHALHDRAQANGVRCEIIDAAALREREPHAAGLAALLVPETGIVDFARVCAVLVDRARHAGTEIVLNARMERIDTNGSGVVVESTAGAFEGTHLINCAGLYSDRVAAMGGVRPEAKIVPFRGEFYALRPEARHLCKHLIYPLPDPSFPFLGAHFTRSITGGVECGPNAVLAFAREGYTKTALNPRDLVESLTYPGFLRLARSYWRTGLGELWRSFSKVAFVRTLQRLVPEIAAADLLPAPAGVRAQALRRDGTLVDDFLLVESGHMLHVVNAPSPAATAALAIADRIVQMVE